MSMLLYKFGWQQLCQHNAVAYLHMLPARSLLAAHRACPLSWRRTLNEPAPNFSHVQSIVHIYAPGKSGMTSALPAHSCGMPSHAACTLIAGSPQSMSTELEENPQ